MEDDFYPHLPDGAVFALDVILQNLAEDPEYLELSPYSTEEVSFLTRLAGPAAAEDVEEISDEDKWTRLEKESNALFKALTEAGKTLQTGDKAQQMSYFRTATQLLDKIVGIQERTANLKQIHQFHHTVLTIMEDVLEPGQRTSVMERLKGAITDGA